MRPSLSFKTLLRTPLKTIMTFLLIALASYALFSRIADTAFNLAPGESIEFTIYINKTTPEDD